MHSSTLSSYNRLAKVIKTTNRYMFNAIYVLDISIRLSNVFFPNYNSQYYLFLRLLDSIRDKGIDNSDILLNKGIHILLDVGAVQPVEFLIESGDAR